MGMTTTTAAIESALHELRDLPTPVRSWRVEAGRDATEEPAVWVWATLEDERADLATRSQLRDMVRDAVRRAGDGIRWVYVRFRGASESPEA